MIYLHDPTRYYRLQPCIHAFKEPTWAEKQVQSLRWKGQQRVAKWNGYLVWTLLVIAGIIGVLFGGLLGYVLHNRMIGYPFGILLFAALLHLHDWLTERWPTDPNYVRLNRRTRRASRRRRL